MLGNDLPATENFCALTASECNPPAVCRSDCGNALVVDADIRSESRFSDCEMSHA